jgi:CheY-like chemotaxis protein
MSEKILAVDAEPMIINAIERVFIDTDYEFCSAQSPEEGFTLLAQQPIDMVIADLMLLPVNGYDFLTRVRQQSPRTARILLSSVSNKAQMLRAVAHGAAHAYMTKPWDNAFLKGNVERMFALRTAGLAWGGEGDPAEFQHLGMAAAQYAHFAAIAAQISAVDSLNKFIGLSVPLTAKILHLVNSAFLGVTSGSLRRALELLGIDGLKELVVSQPQPLFADQSAALAAQCQTAQLHAELRVQVVHKLFREQQGREMGDELAAAALLCDIERFVSPAASGGRAVTPAEGADGFGSWLLDIWNMPAPIVEAAAGFRCPSKAQSRYLEREFLAMVHAADVFAWQQVENDVSRQFDPAVGGILKIEPEALLGHLGRIAGR